MHGVAVDAGSSLRDALKRVRGNAARDDDLLTFKRCVVRTLGHDATTVLVDATFGPDLLGDFVPGCSPMLAYEADAYLISDKDRITLLPEGLTVADYRQLGVDQLKFFTYYGPRCAADLNRRKQDLVADIGAQCRQAGVRFLFEPLVYDEALTPGSPEFAREKPRLVAEATATFAEPRFFVDTLKVEVPVDLGFVEGHADGAGEALMSRAEAEAAFRTAADAAGDVPIVYLSAGVTFDRFRASLRIAREAGVHLSGFMCGRAIWSDGVAVFGEGGEPALDAWLQTTGVERLNALIAALSEPA